ncbi:MAG: PepSY domain-containing protein [Burkholderiaceae bacterium]
MMNHATSFSPAVSGTACRSGAASRRCRRSARHIVLVSTLVALLALPPVVGYTRDDKDHDRARKALMSGEVLSLRQVLDIVGRDYPGEPVEIEFEDDDGSYVYEIKLLQPAGSVLKMKVDATTGTVIKVKGRDIERRNGD